MGIEVNYADHKRRIKEIKSDLYHLTTKMMLDSGIRKGYRTKQEFTDNFNDLVPERYREYTASGNGSLNEDFYRDRFIDDAFFYLVNIPGYLDTDLKIGTFTFVTGDDVGLQYFYECDVCHSVIIVDHSDESCENPLVCRHCHPDAKNTHRIIEVGTKDWEAGQDWFNHEKRLNTDKVYRDWCEFKSKVWWTKYHLTKWFRPSYWKAIREFKKKHSSNK